MTDSFIKENSTITTGSVVTIGKFEALHKGHEVIFRAMRQKKKEGLRAVVIRIVKEPSEPGILASSELKERFREEGIDEVFTLPLTPEIRNLTPTEFLSEWVAKINIKALIVGEDFTFGKNGSGDVTFLRDMASKFSYTLTVLTKEKEDKAPYSSTTIREALSVGDMKTVQSAFSGDYRISGPVIHGQKIGRTIGFPTLNIDFSKDKLLPKEGVYFGKLIRKNETLFAIANIGSKPTFSEEKTLLEVHVLDFSEEIYGETVSFVPLEKIRDIFGFKSKEELRNQLTKDKEKAFELMNLYK